MFHSITQSFKKSPTWYYAMSIAASWAGVGSLMNSATMTRTLGMVPSLVWCIGNSIACILFGLIIEYMPNIREIMRAKVTSFIIGFMSIFQLWINMNGIREVFADTSIGTIGGTVIVYIVCIAFIIILLKNGVIRNALSDSATWIVVYGLLFFVTIAAFLHTGAELNTFSWGLEYEPMKIGITRAFLLLPGPFTYPYFYKILDYNDSNADSTRRVNIRRAFTLGGLMFGFYMLFAYSLAFVQFTPALNIIKAILITIVGVSTMTTFIYSEYVVFGARWGLLIDVVSVVFWPLFISVGVMGVWVLMAEIRIYLFGLLLIAALIKGIAKKIKQHV